MFDSPLNSRAMKLRVGLILLYIALLIIVLGLPACSPYPSEPQSLTCVKQAIVMKYPDGRVADTSWMYSSPVQGWPCIRK